MVAFQIEEEVVDMEIVVEEGVDSVEGTDVGVEVGVGEWAPESATKQAFNGLPFVTCVH